MLSVYTRHSADCKHYGDKLWRRCNCPICFWQVGLAHFGGLFWPTPWNVEVSRVVFGSAGA